jgi:hypothetical protein
MENTSVSMIPQDDSNRDSEKKTNNSANEIPQDDFNRDSEKKTNNSANEIPSKFQHLANKLFFRMMDPNENRVGFQYVDGLNRLKKEFTETESCDVDDLYFTDIEHIFGFLFYGYHLRKITLPLDDPDFKCVKSPVKYENLSCSLGNKYQLNRWRANMIILGEKYDLADVETFKYLVKLGANIKVHNNHAIAWASYSGYLEIVKYLVELGADYCCNNNFPITSASSSGRLEVVKFLVEIGVNPCVNGNAPIRYASAGGHLDVVKFLVENGADPTAEDNYAVKQALKYGCSEVVEYLLKHGATLSQ